MLPVFVEMLVTRRDFIEYALKYQQGTVYERMSVSPDDLLSIKVMVPCMTEESQVEIEEMRAKAEQKRERARVRAAQRKREKAEREAEQQNMVREQVQEPVEPQPTYSNNGYYAQ